MMSPATAEFVRVFGLIAGLMVGAFALCQIVTIIVMWKGE
jgi:hypothetical protein